MRAGRRPGRKSPGLALVAKGHHVEGVLARVGHFHPRRIARDAGNGESLYRFLSFAKERRREIPPPLAGPGRACAGSGVGHQLDSGVAC
jgi:hypothetical protein